MNANRTDREGELYAAIRTYGGEASFAANVITTSHRRPTRKLAGLLKLLQQGKDVRTAGHAIDVLIVDGQQFDWAKLETVK